MKKKNIISLITIMVFLTNIFVINVEGNIKPLNIINNNKETIYVDDNNTAGPWEGTFENPYQYIQDAIENATEGNIIYVLEGVYYESIIIYKPLSIFGVNKSSTIIDGIYEEFVVNISADYVYINNFTIRNSGGYFNNAGIRVNSKNNQITECIFYRTKTGIKIHNSSKNEIKDCIFHTNGEGIWLQTSSSILILKCCFCHNGLGLRLEKCLDISIEGCYAYTNGVGYFFNSSSNVSISKCAVYNNNDNQGGFYLDSCSDFIISNCNFRHNGFGMKIDESSKISISNSNFFWNTHSAMYIEENSYDIIIVKCNIYENFRFGVYGKTAEMTINYCNIYNSTFGMMSKRSSINAQHNWWGSYFGPALFDRSIKERVFLKFGRTKIFPWRMERIPNAGSDWRIDDEVFNVDYRTSRFNEIDLSGQDSDNDLIPDWWEEKWGYNPLIWNDHKHLDPDEDALNNIEECFTDKWDSNPFHKDVFIELDWVERSNSNTPNNKPSQEYIDKMINAFKRRNITLHFDIGNLGGGEEITFITNFSFADLRDLYWKYFLHNDLNNPRKGVFRYILVCGYGVYSGFSFFGWNNLDSFQIGTQMLQRSFPLIPTDRLIIGGSIHELGHTFGLTVDDHGGIDNRVATFFFTYQWWLYKNYKSCMNYAYTYSILDYSDASHGKGDFDDWNNLDFSFFKNTHFKWPIN